MTSGKGIKVQSKVEQIGFPEKCGPTDACAALAAIASRSPTGEIASHSDSRSKALATVTKDVR